MIGVSIVNLALGATFFAVMLTEHASAQIFRGGVLCLGLGVVGWLYFARMLVRVRARNESTLPS